MINLDDIKEYIQQLKDKKASLEAELEAINNQLAQLSSLSAVEPLNNTREVKRICWQCDGSGKFTDFNTGYTDICHTCKGEGFLK